MLPVHRWGCIVLRVPFLGLVERETTVLMGPPIFQGVGNCTDDASPMVSVGVGISWKAQ